MRLIVVSVPVVIALPVIDAKVVKALLGNGELAARIWIAAESTGRNRIRIGVIVSLRRGSPEEVEFINAESFSKVEQLEVLLAPSTGVQEAITRRDCTLDFKPAL